MRRWVPLYTGYPFNGGDPVYGRWLDWYMETYYIHRLAWLQ